MTGKRYTNTIQLFNMRLLATVAVTDLVLFLVFPHNNFRITPALVLAKLYSNTLLVMLNSRMHVSTARDDSTIARHSRWPTLNFIQPTQGTSGQVEDRGMTSDDLHMSDRTDVSTIYPIHNRSNLAIQSTGLGSLSHLTDIELGRADDASPASTRTKIVLD